MYSRWMGKEVQAWTSRCIAAAARQKDHPGASPPCVRDLIAVILAGWGTGTS